MAFRHPLMRHTAPSSCLLRAQHTSRALTTSHRLDVAEGIPSRPTSSSKLLDAIAPEPVERPRSTAPSTPSMRQVAKPHQRGIDLLGQMAQRMPSSGTDTMTRSELARKSKGIERMQYRNWRVGDVYAPHDLSPEELKRYSKQMRPKADVFDVLNIDPLDEYKNLPLMLDFVTTLGRLRHQKETGLRPVNQRKISKAVRRAMGVGLLPRTHAHPEMLRRPGPWFRRP